MENASKALLMAAGVLIGVMILTTMIVLFTTFGDLGREYNQKLETQSIMEFNNQFTKYVRTAQDMNKGKGLKAQEVLSLAKLVKEWNDSGTNEQITMTVNGNDYTTIDYDFLVANNNEIDVRDDTDVNGNPIKVTSYPTFTMEINEYYSSGRVKSIIVN